jgi:energy-coupling factor transporter ATP-binding protein EcfA2
VRRAEEGKAWVALNAQKNWPDVVGSKDLPIALTDRCVVLGGRNGSGKSRMLRELASALGSRAMYIDLHYLTQYVLQASRRDDPLEEMLDEYDPVELADARLADVSRIVGRDYDDVEWFGLDIDTGLAVDDPHMDWLSDEVFPYFRMKFRGVQYASNDMGLGELGVHLLFWYLEQWRESRSDIEVLLLDEPDAYLPPVAAESLLRRLIALCAERRWRLVITSHAQPVIEDAAKNDAFVRLEMGAAGGSEATHVREVATAADDLLADPPIRQVAYVEDESALYLVRALLEALDRRAARSALVVWGRGSGYMDVLRRKIPKLPGSPLQFSFFFDGDKRSEIKPSKAEWWPVVFLPSTRDPDELFRDLGDAPDVLAAALNVDARELRWKLEEGGKDKHDWVNDLGRAYGRQRVLGALAELWVGRHPDLVKVFEADLREALES